MSYSCDDDALNIATKSWNRIVEVASKTGYREGIQDGSSSITQQGFDIGYEEGFKVAFILGKYKGLATILPQDIEHPSDIKSILNMTRRGACYLCISESRNANDNIHTENKMLVDVIHMQRNHSTKIINRLHEYFQPLLNQHGLNIAQLNI